MPPVTSLIEGSTVSIARRLIRISFAYSEGLGFGVQK